ncbi:hypothetical protein LY56_01740 [Roseinatronobacter thiooxidans]|uniref:Uncharacterized protein n=1 Tax=Roseinatronobacter thiooxidans TaxID=121821 RepID=A0A2W7R4Z6_9RHOB|nr:hypothetical protein [Roseinatronobacter thiooxidans]PZX45715.1 hypothetical protein LY56_01740 [Roseinatronobacter thiooxidans]
MKMFNLWAKKHPASVTVGIQGPGIRQSAFPTDFEALWSDMSRKFDAQGAHYKRAALMGFDHGSAARLREICAQLKVTHCAEFASVQILCNPGAMQAHDVIILNVDAFEDVVQAVDVLHHFRASLPSIAVILISSAVRGDDFGSERLPICDATLRAPATLPRLKGAFRAAMSSQGTARTGHPAY